MNVQEHGAYVRQINDAAAQIKNLPLELAPQELRDGLEAYEDEQTPYDIAQSAETEAEDALEDAKVLWKHDSEAWVAAGKPGLPDETAVKRAEIALGLAQQAEREAAILFTAKRSAFQRLAQSKRIRDEWRTNITDALPNLQTKLATIAERLPSAVGEIEHLISATHFLGQWPNETWIKSSTGYDTALHLKAITDLKPWTPPTPKPVAGPAMTIDPTAHRGETISHVA